MKSFKSHLKNIQEKTDHKFGPQHWDNDYIDTGNPNGPWPNQPIPSLPPANPDNVITPSTPGGLSVSDPNEPQWYPANNHPNPPDQYWYFDRDHNIWRLSQRIGNGGLFQYADTRSSGATWPIQQGQYFWNPSTGEFELYDGSNIIDFWWRWIHGMPVW